MGTSSSSSSSGAQEGVVREAKPATDALARMCAELLQGLLSSPAAGRGSAFLSPLSLSLALAMAAAGARGKTEEGILRALCAEGGSDKLGQQMGRLSSVLASSDSCCMPWGLLTALKRLRSEGLGTRQLATLPCWSGNCCAGDWAPRRVKFSMANAIWSKTLLKSYVELCVGTFKAEARLEEPKAEAINNWCKTQTQGKIPQLLNPQTVLDPQGAVLTNALYFKGEWQTKFDPLQTTNAQFHGASGSSPCKMMLAKGTNKRFLYHETNTYQAAALPYGKGDYSALVLLPRADSKPTFSAFASPGIVPGAAAAPRAGSLEEVLAALPAEWPNLANPGQASAASLTMQKGTLKLPRFKAEFGGSMKELLASRGMQRAFTAEADFGAMCETKLQIDDVIHRTVVEVDEAGTTAAAATAVVIARSVDVTPSFTMVCNRPFLFLIRHNSTNAILFAGAVRAM